MRGKILFLLCVLCLAVACRGESAQPPFNIILGTQENLLNGALYLDTTHPTGVFSIAPLGDYKILAKEVASPVEEWFYGSNSAGGEPTVEKREDVSNCVSASLTNEGTVPQVALKFNPLCQRCGGNYFVSLEATTTQNPYVTFPINEQFYLPCQADVLMVFRSSKIKESPSFNLTVQNYFWTIAQEGLNARFVDLDSKESQASFGIKPIDDAQAEKDAALPPTGFSGEIQVGNSFTESTKLPNQLDVFMEQVYSPRKNPATGKIEPGTLEENLVIKPSEILYFPGTSASSLVLKTPIFKFDFASKKIIFAAMQGSSRTIDSSSVSGTITFEDVSTVGIQTATFDYGCNNLNGTIFMVSGAYNSAEEYYQITCGKNRYHLAYRAGFICITKEKGDTTCGSAQQMPKTDQGLKLSFTKGDDIPAPTHLQLGLAIENKDEYPRFAALSNAVFKEVKARLDKIRNVVNPKYLILVGGVQVLPSFITDLKKAAQASRESLVPSDDYYGYNGNSFSPDLVIARLPTEIDTADTFIPETLLANAVSARQKSISLPTIISDSCGNKNCDIREETDTVSKVIYGSPCGETNNCFYSPPYCIDEGNDCTKKAELGNLIRSSSDLYFGLHGSGYSFGSRDEQGKHHSVADFYSIAFQYSPNLPAITSEPCFGASIDFDSGWKKLSGEYPPLVIAFLQSGARLFVGNTRSGWGRSSSGSEKYITPHIISQFIAYALSRNGQPALSQQAFDALGTARPEKALTAGEAFLLMKKPLLSDLSSESKSSLSTAEKFSVLTLTFYGDPTQKLVVNS